MSNIVDFHPLISQPSAIPHPDIDGEYLCNIAMCIRIAKEGETPKAKFLYRAYIAEFHALKGQPLSHEKREEIAFLAAAAKLGWKVTPQA